LQKAKCAAAAHEQQQQQAMADSIKFRSNHAQPIPGTLCMTAANQIVVLLML
jgi:hypothetical protein